MGVSLAMFCKSVFVLRYAAQSVMRVMLFMYVALWSWGQWGQRLLMKRFRVYSMICVYS